MCTAFFLQLPFYSKKIHLLYYYRHRNSFTPENVHGRKWIFHLYLYLSFFLFLSLSLSCSIEDDGIERALREERPHLLQTLWIDKKWGP